LPIRIQRAFHVRKSALEPHKQILQDLAQALKLSPPNVYTISFSNAKFYKSHRGQAVMAFAKMF
jgi:hypothetical protein